MSHDLLPDIDLPALDLFGGEVTTKAQPTPRVLRRAAREKFVRGLKKETLAALIPTPPAAGECLHVVSNGTFDYFNFIPLILGWIGGPADSLYGSTWTMNRANVDDLLKMFDDGKIRQVSIASGNYFLRRESAVAATLLLGLRERGQRFVTWENHTKVILLASAAADAWYVVEGSANWTANPRTEQNILLNDRATWEFHKAWLEEMFATVAPAKMPTDATPTRTGFSQRRAGLGVLSVHSDRATRDRVVAWKTRGEEDQDETGRMASELAALMRQAIPVPPSGCVLTIPPQGASAPGPYFARALGRRVANATGLPLVEILQRSGVKEFHGRRASLAQRAYSVSMTVPAVIVIDDLITSGNTLRLSLAALRAAEIPCWGFAYNGS
jgi:hypothetical protein